MGTPQDDEASETYKKCEATANEQKKAEFAATRDTWAASLDKLSSGGWVFLLVSSDGTFAVFGSHRHATREGNVATIWLRFEYREEQVNGSETYKSLVERNKYDCVRMTSKEVSSTYYGENNLGSGGSSLTFDESKAAWTPAIPGTLGDELLDWACKSTPRPSKKEQQP